MGFRFRKSIKIAPGFRINFSKSGTSLSVGGKGFTTNFSSRGTRQTIGIPGTGISYTSTSGKPHGPSPRVGGLLKLVVLGVVGAVGLTVIVGSLSESYVAPRASPLPATSTNHSAKDAVTAKGGIKPEVAAATPVVSRKAATPLSADAVALAWPKLRVGMSQTDVEALLGGPNMRATSKWYYTGNRWVRFNAQGVLTEFGGL